MKKFYLFQEQRRVKTMIDNNELMKKLTKDANRLQNKIEGTESEKNIIIPN